MYVERPPLSDPPGLVDLMSTTAEVEISVGADMLEGVAAGGSSEVETGVETTGWSVVVRMLVVEKLLVVFNDIEEDGAGDTLSLIPAGGEMVICGRIIGNIPGETE